MHRIAVRQTEKRNGECGEITLCASETLSKIGPNAKDAVPALARVLEHEEAVVRSAAAELLGSLGADAKDAVPALIKALAITAEVDCGQEEDDVEMDQAEAKEWEAGFHRLVAEALGKIGPDACEAVPDLIGLLADEDEDIRRAAAGSLGAIGRAQRRRHQTSYVYWMMIVFGAGRRYPLERSEHGRRFPIS